MTGTPAPSTRHCQLGSAEQHVNHITWHVQPRRQGPHTLNTQLHWQLRAMKTANDSPSSFFSFLSLVATWSFQSPSAECFSSSGLPQPHQHQRLINYSVCSLHCTSFDIVATPFWTASGVHTENRSNNLQTFIMPRPHMMQALSDDACLTSVCRVHRPKSRTERPRKTKLAQR